DVVDLESVADAHQRGGAAGVVVQNTGGHLPDAVGLGEVGESQGAQEAGYWGRSRGELTFG
ncbi:MAG: hypothetical protein AB8I80_01035, partial [Anaerolineae bacterium]